MKKVPVRLFYFWLLACMPLAADIGPSDWDSERAATVEEALFLRRIADFWQEGEYRIAKGQMEEFLETFPLSSFSDPLRAVLGDLLLREKNHSEALKSYSAIASEEFLEKVFLNKMQCLYHLEWYPTLADECEKYLKKPVDRDSNLRATYFLAIALYHQCLNAVKEPGTLQKLARRAEPHFETLLLSELSTETAKAFAHLCCILKDYPKASRIYLDLAAQEPSLEEEMSFQAALIQAEYDKSMALHSFETIEKKGGKRSKEAAYNRLVLLFDAGCHEAITNNKSQFLESIPEGKVGMAHLFFGRSFLALKNYPEAIEDLSTFLTEKTEVEPEWTQSALTCLLEASYQSNDLGVLDKALSKLSEMAPASEHVTKGHLSRVLLLKKFQNFDSARSELKAMLETVPDFPDRPKAIFEWMDLEYQAKLWSDCRDQSIQFLTAYPHHELAPSAWRYLAAASGRAAKENPKDKGLQQQFVLDLEALLNHKEFFPLAELNDWEFFLSKARYDLGETNKAADSLKKLLRSGHPFAQEANAYLLSALCHRDVFGDLASFCLYAETALEKQADLIEQASLHSALFNAYLELSKQAPELIEKGAEHLFEAFSLGADIVNESLHWLGDFYFSRFEQESAPVCAERATRVFESLKTRSEASLIESPLVLEISLYRLGKLHSLAGRQDEQISVLDQLIDCYGKKTDVDWKWEKEARLLLAEGYAAKGNEEKALLLLDEIVANSPTIRSEAAAKATLGRAHLAAARLKKWTPDDPELVRIASQFKDLILQRRLANEPVHLEAALEYVDLIEKTSDHPIEKRLGLLEKIKLDFESSNDLLSKDYQQARTKLPMKNRIYEGYMRLIDGEILLAKSALSPDFSAQKELKERAKDLLMQIKSEKAHSALMSRASRRLQNSRLADVSTPE